MMGLEQKQQSEQLYQQLGLDPIVNKVLKEFTLSLSGMDRILDKMFGPYDIKGRAEEVAKMTALIARDSLNEKYHKETVKLESQIADGNLKIKWLDSEKTNLATALALTESNYEELRIAIKMLARTIPYHEIREKLGQELYTFILKDSGGGDKLLDGVDKLINFKKYLGMAAEKGAVEAGRYAETTLKKVITNKKIDTVRIKLTLYTHTKVLGGSVYYPRGERLSDHLNGAGDQQGWASSPFLELSNVNVHDPHGHDKILPTVHIKKAVIYMVALADINAGRGVGAKDGVKSLPFVPKSAVPVELRMVDYVLIGNMYCVHGQKPQDVLNEIPRFLPLTDVAIRQLGHKTELMAPFVAVNKEKISQLEQQEISPASLRLIRGYYRKILEMRLGFSN